jgi:hypothetical protein
VRIGRWIGCQRAFPAAVAHLDVRFEFMRMNLLWPLGTLLALLTIGCGGTKHSPEELKIGVNVPLAAGDAEDPEWIGIAGGKGQGERALFEKVIELKRPVPRGGSIGTHLQMREGAPLPSVLVYRGTNRWAEDNVFVGEFRVREWPRPDGKSVVARVGFQITEQHELLMWLRDPGPDRKGVANPEYAVPIAISRVAIDGTEPAD